MSMTQEKSGGDIVQNMIQETLLGVKGVSGVTIQRTTDGFDVRVIPEPGATAEPLRQQISSAIAKSLPHLEKYIRITIGTGVSKKSKGPAGVSSSRIELAGVTVSSDQKGRFTVTVRLSRPDREPSEVTKEGVYLTANVIRLAAEATLEAALSFFPEDSDGAVVGTKCFELSDKDLVVVLLTLVLKEGRVTASGSACIKNEVHVAAAMATLKAINRYLEFYDKD